MQTDLLLYLCEVRNMATLTRTELIHALTDTDAGEEIYLDGTTLVCGSVRVNLPSQEIKEAKPAKIVFTKDMTYDEKDFTEEVSLPVYEFGRYDHFDSFMEDLQKLVGVSGDHVCGTYGDISFTLYQYNNCRIQVVTTGKIDAYNFTRELERLLKEMQLQPVFIKDMAHDEKELSQTCLLPWKPDDFKNFRQAVDGKISSNGEVRGTFQGEPFVVHNSQVRTTKKVTLSDLTLALCILTR